MVGHDGALPHLYLGEEAVNLGELLFEDGTSKGTKDDVRKVCPTPAGAYVALKASEQWVPTSDAEGEHIQAATTIVVPFSTTVLVVLGIMGVQASAYQFFFRCRHNVSAKV